MRKKYERTNYEKPRMDNKPPPLMDPNEFWLLERWSEDIDGVHSVLLKGVRIDEYKALKGDFWFQNINANGIVMQFSNGLVLKSRNKTKLTDLKNTAKRLVNEYRVLGTMPKDGRNNQNRERDGRSRIICSFYRQGRCHNNQCSFAHQ